MVGLNLVNVSYLDVLGIHKYKIVTSKRISAHLWGIWHFSCLLTNCVRMPRIYSNYSVSPLADFMNLLTHRKHVCFSSMLSLKGWSENVCKISLSIHKIHQHFFPDFWNTPSRFFLTNSLANFQVSCHSFFAVVFDKFHYYIT